MRRFPGSIRGLRAALLALAALVAVAGCATLSPDYEEPTVALTSFRSLPSEGVAPAFEVGLRIINPNPDDLVLQGIVYTIRVDGRDVVKGVGKDFPVVEGYSQQDVTLTASVDLLGGLQFIADRVRAQTTTMRYEFEARLDLAGLYPTIRVSEKGEFDLGAGAR